MTKVFRAHTLTSLRGVDILSTIILLSQSRPFDKQRSAWIMNKPKRSAIATTAIALLCVLPHLASGDETCGTSPHTCPDPPVCATNSCSANADPTVNGTPPCLAAGTLNLNTYVGCCKATLCVNQQFPCVVEVTSSSLVKSSGCDMIGPFLQVKSVTAGNIALPPAQAVKDTPTGWSGLPTGTGTCKQEEVGCSHGVNISVIIGCKCGGAAQYTFTRWREWRVDCRPCLAIPPGGQ